MSLVFDSLRDYLVEKRLTLRPFFSIPLVTKWPTIFLFFLVLLLPFVFRFLRLHDEEEILKKRRTQLDMEIAKEQQRKSVLDKEQKYLDDPRFLEVMMMERLGVVPRGAQVILKE